MAFNYSPKIVTDGLVLCLDAGNPNSYPGSGNTWTDLSRGRNNGTLVNGPTFSGENQGSIVFDGVDDEVAITIPGIPTGASPRTVNIWFKYTKYSQTFYSIAGYGTQSIGRTFDIGIIDSTGVLFLDGYGGGYGASTGEAIPEDTWGLATAIYTGTQQQIYYNGVLKGSNNVTLDTASSTFQLGDMTWSTPKFLNGSIAHVSFYNRALSASEISQNYNATKGRFGL